MDPRSPVTVAGVHVAGHARTRQAFFEAEFANARQCRTVEELYVHLNEVNSRLERLGIFEGIETTIRILDTPLSSAPRLVPLRPSSPAAPRRVAIDVAVKEVGIPFLKLESYVTSGGAVGSSSSSSSSVSSSKGDIGCQIQGALRNPLGHGEVIKMSVGRSTAGGKEHVLDCTVPNFLRLPRPAAVVGKDEEAETETEVGRPAPRTTSTFVRRAAAAALAAVPSEPFELYLGAKKIEENPAYFVSHRQLTHALSAELVSRDGAHKLSAELAVRDEVPVSPTTAPGGPGGGPSAGLLALLDSSAKSAVKYVFTHDSRDLPSNPSRGVYAQGTVELAAPPPGWPYQEGSARFLRTDGVAQAHTRVEPALTGLWRAVRAFMGAAVEPPAVGTGAGTGTGVVLSAVGHVGVLWPLGLAAAFGAASPSTAGAAPFRAYLTDRYHGGGALSLRGFDGYGIGPRAVPSPSPTPSSSSALPAPSPSPATAAKAAKEEPGAGPVPPSVAGGEALGGFTKLGGLLMLSAPVRIKALGPDAARTFVFLNVGSVGLGHARCAATDPFFGHLRASVGTGVALSVGSNVRFELSYAVPVLRARHDVVKPFQIGVGLSIS